MLANTDAPVWLRLPVDFRPCNKNARNRARAIIRNDQNNVPETCAPIWSGHEVYHVIAKGKSLDLAFLNVLGAKVACPAAQSAIK
jgi:hypothetical protein